MLVEKDDVELFATLIREASKDLSDKELAALLCIARPTVNMWRNGTSTPPRLVKRVVYATLIKRFISGPVLV